MINEEARRIDRIINDLVTSINTDISPIIQPGRPEGGYFGVPRMVFCYIDFLGLLYSGWSGNKKKNGDKDDFATPQKAKIFIKKVLSHIDKLYEKHGDLLYDMYRHGTVHIYSPKKMVSRTDPNKTIEWLLYKGDREQWDYYENKAVKFQHLEIIKWEEDRFMLPVSIVVLYRDLLESIDLYRTMIYKDKSGDLARNLLAVADGLDQHFDSTSHKFWY
ncbi:hypothetical protein HYW42_00760 [Candidatus Daviesbacteria bacterium]|nr:hypothetical protein [Candidatus Daviesbacteria bacterium]